MAIGFLESFLNNKNVSKNHVTFANFMYFCALFF